MVRCHSLRDGARKCLGVVPWRGPDGQDHMQAFSARRLEEGLEAEIRQSLAHLAGGRDDIRPPGAWAWIEVEHEPVAGLQGVGRGAARMDLQYTRLHQGDDAVEIVDSNDVVTVGLGDEVQAFFFDSGACVLLEEAL